MMLIGWRRNLFIIFSHNGDSADQTIESLLLGCLVSTTSGITSSLHFVISFTSIAALTFHQERCWLNEQCSNRCGEVSDIVR
jgi:hypothetical protein